MQKKQRLFFLIILISFLGITSCSQRYQKYLQDENEFFGDDQTEFSNQPPDYLIRPFDILYVRISTNNAEINNLFNKDDMRNQNQSGQNFDYSFLSNYNVNDSGFIYIPIVGKINVVDKNIFEIQRRLQNSVDLILNDAIVAVKLVSFRVTFLGEVAQQGTHTFYRDRLNILEAIANIGGITDYGNKQNVMLVRTINGNSKVFRLNLADRKILESQFYYLVPNDILVVEPIKFKTNQTAISNLSFYLSAITSTLTALFLVSNILK